MSPLLNLTGLLTKQQSSTMCASHQKTHGKVGRYYQEGWQTINKNQQWWVSNSPMPNRPQLMLKCVRYGDTLWNFLQKPLADWLVDTSQTTPTTLHAWTQHTHLLERIEARNKIFIKWQITWTQQCTSQYIQGTRWTKPTYLDELLQLLLAGINRLRWMARSPTRNGSQERRSQWPQQVEKNNTDGYWIKNIQ